MNDLISRQALCEYALNQKDKSVTPNDIVRFPSTQQEQGYADGKATVVHCKDCRYWSPQEKSLQGRGRCELFGMYPTSSWFCGNARRKEE